MRQPLFGLSAAGYRLEGGFNGYGEPANNWTASERAGKVPLAPRPSPGIWEDPGPVLELASAAGAESLALSVEWARIEPRPGVFDETAVERYAATFAAAAARGIAPVAVLHDDAHPAWLGEEFWLTPGAPDRFSDHVARLVAPLSPFCRHWVTLRRPNLVALAGWVDGRSPPRRLGALADAWAVIDNFLAAHLLAYGAIREVQPGAEVLLGLRWSSSYDWHRLMLDLLCAPALGVERDGVDAWIADRRARHDEVAAPAGLGELAWRRLAAATAPFGSGRLARPSPRRALDLAYRLAADRAPVPGGSNGSAPAGGRGYPLDALLLGWCPPHAVATSRPPARAASPGSRPDPDGLGAWCRAQADATPGLALWVEDGFATRPGAPRADGWDRRSYLRAQGAALRRAAARDGVPVGGYLYFSPGRGGEPTWPEADFGLGRDAPDYRRLVAGGPPSSDPSPEPV